MIKQDPTREDKDREDAIHDVGSALKALSEFGEQIAYGAIAFGATGGILKFGFGIETHAWVEPAILNAGIAYYTHAATGRLVRALVILAKPPARKVAEARVIQVIVVKRKERHEAK